MLLAWQFTGFLERGTSKLVDLLRQHSVAYIVELLRIVLATGMQTGLNRWMDLFGAGPTLNVVTTTLYQLT